MTQSFRPTEDAAFKNIEDANSTESFLQERLESLDQLPWEAPVSAESLPDVTDFGQQVALHMNPAYSTQLEHYNFNMFGKSAGEIVDNWPNLETDVVNGINDLYLVRPRGEKNLQILNCRAGRAAAASEDVREQTMVLYVGGIRVDKELFEDKDVGDVALISVRLKYPTTQSESEQADFGDPWDLEE